MWLDLVRIIGAWVLVCGIIAFWYWVMKNIGTF